MRRAQRGTWSALFVLGATVLLAIPFYEFGHSVVGHCKTSADGTIAAHSLPDPRSLVLARGPRGGLRRHRRDLRAPRAFRGVGARVRPYVIGGIVLAVAATLMTVWGIQHPLSWSVFGTAIAPPGSLPQAWLHRLVSPLGVIGLGLLVLARVERSRAVAAFGVVYLVAVAASAPIGVHPGRLFLPGILVPGLVLLAGERPLCAP